MMATPAVLSPSLLSPDLRSPIFHDSGGRQFKQALWTSISGRATGNRQQEAAVNCSEHKHCSSRHVSSNCGSLGTSQDFEYKMTLLQHIQLHSYPQSYRSQTTPESSIHVKQVLFVLNRLNGTVLALAHMGTSKPKKNGSQSRVQMTYPARLDAALLKSCWRDACKGTQK